MMAERVRTRGAFTSETLKLMRQTVDDWSKVPVMVMAARDICRLARAVTPMDESRAIWGWVRAAVDYRLDPVDTQWIQDPFETMVVTRAGNCANMAILCATLLQAIGHPCSVAAIKWEGRDDFSHAVCIDKMTGSVVDPVSPTFNTYFRPVAAQLEA
jgi:transglutaminase-like putative cysteine protease